MNNLLLHQDRMDISEVFGFHELTPKWVGSSQDTPSLSVEGLACIKRSPETDVPFFVGVNKVFAKPQNGA